MTKPTDAELKSLLARVANASFYYPEYRYKAWGYGEWIAMEGLLLAAAVCENARYAGFVEGLVSGWISKRERLLPADHVAPGVAMLKLYESTGERIYLERAHALADLLLSSPRSSRGPRLLRPDANAHVYVDCIYSDPTLFCKLGLMTKEPRWFLEAVNYTREFWDVLVDPQIPLLYHGYNDRTNSHIGLLWGRGAGWALLGLVDELVALPPEIPGRDGLLRNLQGMAETLKTLQDADGNWHTVLNHPETYLENSIAAFVFAAFRKAMRFKLLDSSFTRCVARSWEAMMHAIQPHGQIMVSEATPEGDLALYQSLKLGVYPWGQGPVMRAIVEELAGRS